MAFRGFGDDALKVKADKREAALKAAQIAALERASMRSANVQMAGLQENARQADMANERAWAQLAAGNERFDKQLAAEEAARLDDLNIKREGMAADESYRRDVLTLNEQMRKADLGVKLEELSQRERQIQLNEITAARLDAEWKQQQAAQEELQRVDTAIQLAVIRAASLSSGPLGMPYINALNNLRGVAYGDPGSTTQVFPVIDPQTGARLGIGTVKIGDDGKEIQSILDPAIILPQVRKSMSPEKWEEFAQQLIGANKAKGSDRVTAAAIREMQKAKLEFGKTDPGSLLKTLAEQEDNLRFTKAPKSGSGKAADPANQENLERIGRIKTKVLKELEAQLDGETDAASPATKLSPEQKAFVTAPGAGATGTSSDANSAVRDKDKLVVTINGQTARMPDTPKNRAMLQEKYNIQIGGDKAATPEASGAPAPQSATASTGQIPVVEQPPVAEKLTAEQARRRQNAVASTEKAGGSAPASQPATKNVGKQKSWTTPSSTPLFEAGADGKRGKANVEPGKDTQRLGRNKPPAAVELRFTKQQEESLTDEDRRAIAKIYADSLKLEEDPVTGLVPDREAYRKQKVMEYFQQKFETEFERLFGEGKFETEFKRRFGVAPK